MHVGSLSDAVLNASQTANRNIINNDAGTQLPADSSELRYHIKTCGCLACQNRISAKEPWLASGTTYPKGNKQSASIDPSLLISSAFGDITKGYLNGQETFNYYIFNVSTNIQYLEQELQTIQHQDDSIQFINNIFTQLDPLIDLDFKATSNPEESDLMIISVDDWKAWSSDTVGQVVNVSSGWHLLWKDIAQDSLKGNASGSNDSFDANTITHEIGHALGLSHPNEDPFNSQWTTDDSVMSYNISPDGWDFSFSDADIEALQRIWGREDDNLPTNAPPAQTGERAILSEGQEDSAYILTEAELLQGYSDPNGDDLSISNLSASNGVLSDNRNQSWTFKPAKNVNGTVSLSYSVEDGFGGSLDASQSFTVAPVNDKPSLTGNRASLSDGKENSSTIIREDALLQGYSDPDGDQLFITNLSVSSGAIEQTGNRSWIFTPDVTFNGTIRLTYAVVDGYGGSINATNRFKITPIKKSPARRPEAQLAGGADQMASHLQSQPIKTLGSLNLDNRTIIQSKGKQSNRIKGTKKNDLIWAGKGSDVLTGGKGADHFLFAQKDPFGKRGADTIKDFNVDEADRLWLARGRLRGLDSDPTFAAASKKKQLRKLSKKDIDLIYFEPKGQLIYNQNAENDGYGKGGMFAILANEPALSSDAIHVIDS